MKGFKRRVSATINILFSSQKEVDNFYTMMRPNQETNPLSPNVPVKAAPATENMHNSTSILSTSSIHRNRNPLMAAASPPSHIARAA
ncbi:hypothetical protein STCU_09955 [Strigomonas culicis]|uniref:Uncharacterized protein n=1 Tax=Strigomonas culicis TaxID=28005 RepID=S9TP45_9TRYP|nr:hypothetical protein STCU_09955 [Strigomonas culicis]|eukprot:EPY18469.1 hypothetical protein STCU_09955 [Strigomonas culicis]